MSEHVVAVLVDGVRFVTTTSTGQPVTFGAETEADVHLPPALAVPAVTVTPAEDRVTVRTAGQAADGPARGTLRLDAGGREVEVSTTPGGGRSVLDLTGRSQLVVGPQPGASVTTADPRLRFTARRADAGGWLVSVPGDDLLLENARVPAGRYRVRSGEHLGAGPHTLVLLDDELQVDDAAVRAVRLPRAARPAFSPPVGYPQVRRSPRLVYRPPEEKITVVAAPTTDEEGTAGQLAKLIVPPLAMIGVTGAMAIMRGSIVMVLASAVTTLVTLMFSLSGYVKDRRARAEKRAAAERSYREHLEHAAIQVHEANSRQRSGALYHYPGFRTLVRLGQDVSPRIFEKTPLQFDFLSYRLGLGTVASSSEIKGPERDRSGQETELDTLARQICEDGARLERMPITADLMHGPVGYVGPRRLVVEQLQLLVAQLAVFHSPHDVQLVMVFGEQELEDWAWMRWFRHSSLQPMNLRGFVHDQRSRDQVLSSLNQILRARRSAHGDARGGQRTRFSPHHVVVILDESLVLDHVVMEILREDATELGCSVVVVQETMSSLSDAVTTVIDVRDRQTGVLVLEQGELRDVPFALDHIPEGFDTELLPRAVGALEHLRNLTSSIPDAVTFLEMYEVETVEQLAVEERWARNSPHRTLGVPLGLRGPGDVVTLDLHEKAHGPHGLVAGTTGSGKSEIIQSYILSLAVNFHPYDVAFLLIDYKGGGMANLFADLPHLLGTITNLDGAQSMRALVSINAELKRRQRVFSASGVNHINQYQKLYKNGDVAEPMPHLFLISDEFAELKSEQPEFMDELISTARIGRSLGIHLILATQKPSGVVNDQIWSNSKFKLALKVADRSDSMEIIKTPDAAEITLPGRAYLQVGNNEIYELFQSAWSGADYEPDKQENHQDDRTIYAITDLGQYRVLNEDLSGLDRADTVTEVPTELEAVVAGVRRTAEQLAVSPLPRPWLPPLPDRITLTDLHLPDPATAWAGPKQPLRPTVGRVDVPSRQAQETLRLDLSVDGHLVVFGSPGSGRSTFLQTAVLDLTRTHSPAHLHVYLLDMGASGLVALRGLPHVADLLTVEDVDRASRFATRIEEEILRRKHLLSEHGVANLELYERSTGCVLPSLLLVVDSFEGLAGSCAQEAVSAVLHAVAREGAGLGIHLMMSAGRQTSLRAGLSGNIKTQIALRMNDEAEARSIVGRTTARVEDLPGRGLVRLDQPEVFQTALPAAGEDMLAVVAAVRAEAAAMDARWTGARPEPIPVVPDELTVDDLLVRPDVARLLAVGAVPVGLDTETVATVGLDLVSLRRVLVLGRDADAVGELLGTLWCTSRRTAPGESFVLDGAGTVHGGADSTDGGGESLHDVLDAALAELTVRQSMNRTRTSVGHGASRSSGQPPALVVVADSSTIGAAVGKDRLDDLVRLLTDGPGCGMPVLIGAPLAGVGKGTDPVAKLAKTCTSGLVRGALSDQSVLTARNLGFKVPPPGEHEAFLVTEGVGARVRLPETPVTPEPS